MNDNSFNTICNQNYTALAKWLNSLNPYEFAITGVMLGILISQNLNINEQNAIGNWFDEIGQIILTIAAQSTNITQ